MPVDDRRPFGWRAEAESSKDDAAPAPTPVLHVGEVHADLVLHVTEETLTGLGTQIANMLANAAYQGFRAGMESAMADVESDGAAANPPEFDSGGVLTPQPQPVLTGDDLRRARGE